jgi:hypothetical protein
MRDTETSICLQGDRYVDPWMVDRNLTKTLNLPKVEKAFKPANPLSKSCGAGSLFGVFGVVLDTDPSVNATIKHCISDDSLKGKRNIYASPSKQGGAGYAYKERSIGGTGFDHMADEYAPGQRLSKELRAKAREAISKPFKATGRTGNCIVPLGGGGEPMEPVADHGGLLMCPCTEPSTVSKA